MIVRSADELIELGKKLGAKLRGGEVIELVGDIGTGKTTLAKGIALGLGVEEEVASPSFTISRQYPARTGLVLRHYDFYRLPKAGIMRQEIAEALTDPRSVTLVEWAKAVADVLPEDRQIIRLKYSHGPDSREVEL